MISAELHPEEQDRLEALVKYEVLDTDDEKVFDELTQLASEICGTSISLISLVDVERQWFKSKVGLDAEQTDRSIAFCSHAILQDDVFEIPDALKDERFHDNPLVTGAPDIRFYAGAPLVTPSGFPIGTLCVIDQQPLELNDFQKRALKTLSAQVISQLEMRLHARKMERLNKDRERLYAVLAHDLRSPFNGILNLSKVMAQSASSLTPEQIVHLSKEIHTSSVTLYQVLDEILQWSQNRINQRSLVLQPTSVSRVVEETQKLLRDSLKAKDIRLDVNIATDADALADSTLLGAVIRNLITNAIKFTPSDSTITVKANKQNGSVVISVEDEGEGISKELKEHLFVGTVESKQGSLGELGHGLGLSLAGEFMKRLKGEIWVDENYTRGAKICLKLKAAPAD